MKREFPPDTCTDHTCSFRRAVIDALIVSWRYESVHATDAYKAVADLVQNEIYRAFDPAISAPMNRLYVNVMAAIDRAYPGNTLRPEINKLFGAAHGPNDRV